MAVAIKSPSPNDLEKLRLVLSTYQDGSGMLAHEEGATLPGWRDFERAVAGVFCGQAQENKAIFDVLVPCVQGREVYFGFSCKMRRELDRVEKTGRVSIELSNSAGKFWDHLRLRKINQRNYRKQPSEVGNALLGLVKAWHDEVSIERGGVVDLSKSSYLALSWNKEGWYQLFQFSIHLPASKSLRWHFPTLRCLKGDDGSGTVFEWYGESGGQLKYYPLAKDAIWTSKRFQLEPLPDSVNHSLLYKAAMYFPALWSKVSKE